MQLLLILHLQSLLCTIIQNPHVISHRHLTEGTGASEVGLPSEVYDSTGPLSAVNRGAPLISH